jgi:phage-related protein
MVFGCQVVNMMIANLKKGLEDWLGIPIFGILKEGAKSIFSTAAKLLDLTLEGILKRVSNAVGQDLFGVVLKLVEKIVEAANSSDIGAWLEGQISSLKEGLGDLTTSLKEAVSSMIEAGIESAKKEFFTKGLQELLSLLVPGGGIIKILKMVYKAVKWFIENMKKIFEIFNKLVDVFHEAITGASSEDIEVKVVGILGNVLAALLGALASIFGFAGIPAKIKEALKKAADALWKPIEKLLKAITKPDSRGLAKSCAKNQRGRSGRRSCQVGRWQPPVVRQDQRQGDGAVRLQSQNQSRR